MKKFFGTDGIRGVANQDLTPELALRVGRAAAAVLGKKPGDFFLVGKDPRVSSDMLEGALISGVLSAGVGVIRAGIVPTPAVSYLAGTQGALAGIMISASHNPMEHNGIKVFGEGGCKLPDEEEKKIERLLRKGADPAPRPAGPGVGQIRELEAAPRIYIEHLKSRFNGSLSGLHVVLDCAWGAASTVAPDLFESLGARVTADSCVPDGLRINLNCGAAHPDNIRKLTLQEGADLGIAFDGDADRVVFSDKNGMIFNGDHILAALAVHWKKTGRLKGPVVATVMANFGLEQSLRGAGIPMVRAPVGDRFVLEEMKRCGANLGGEQSGHIILPDHAATGDGCLTALQVLSAASESGQSLEELRKLVMEFPQLLVNVPLPGEAGSKWRQDARFRGALKAEAALLKGRGRIVVRPSGTESVVRVMAEGPDTVELRDIVGRIVRTIKSGFVKKN